MNWSRRRWTTLAPIPHKSRPIAPDPQPLASGLRPPASGLRPLFRPRRRPFFLGDEGLRNDAHVRLEPVAAAHASVGQRHRAMPVDGGASLRIGGDAAQQRDDLGFLIELDLFLTQPAFDVGPAEGALV